MKRRPSSASVNNYTRKRNKYNQQNVSSSSTKKSTILDFFSNKKSFVQVRKKSTTLSASKDHLLMKSTSSPDDKTNSSDNPHDIAKSSTTFGFGTPATPATPDARVRVAHSARDTGESTVVTDDSNSNSQVHVEKQSDNRLREPVKRTDGESGTPISPGGDSNTTTSSLDSLPSCRYHGDEEAAKMKGKCISKTNLGTPQLPFPSLHDMNLNNGSTIKTPPSPKNLTNGDDVETPPSPMDLSSFDNLNTPCSPPTTESEWKRRQNEEISNNVRMEVEKLHSEVNTSIGKIDSFSRDSYHVKRHKTDNSPPTNDLEGTPSTAQSPLRKSPNQDFKTASFNNTKATMKTNKSPASSPSSYTSPTSNKTTNKRKPFYLSPSQISNSKKKSHQFYLDFGQSDFGKQTICSICGMLRVHGMQEDDAEHAKVCKEFQQGVAYLGWKTERRVGGFGDDVIVEIRPNDPPQHRKKVMQVKAIVDAELGFSATSASKTNPLNDMTCYLYISKKRVVGLLLVKHLKRAYELISADSDHSRDDNINDYDGSTHDNQHNSRIIKAQKDSYSRSLTPSKAMMGVHQIWCHRSHRKGGIASKLCDAARSCLIFGMTIPLEYVAFSSPTLDGIKFAKKYLDTKKPLVYDMS